MPYAAWTAAEAPSHCPPSPTRRRRAAAAAGQAKMLSDNASGRANALSRRLLAEQRVGAPLPSAGVDGRPSSRCHLDSQGRVWVPSAGADSDFVDEGHTQTFQSGVMGDDIQVGDMAEFLESDANQGDVLPASWKEMSHPPTPGSAAAPIGPSGTAPNAPGARGQTAGGTRPRPGTSPAQGAADGFPAGKGAGAGPQRKPPQSAADARAPNRPPSAGDVVPASVRTLIARDPYVVRHPARSSDLSRWTHDRIRNYRVPAQRPR
eukprot:TRINITY_DN15520_c0_g1_i1.p1 TRINITY_DN15520_c0_g1~~TRINITY_DN15520_c0_g1_i1.p1  ORF type:complete len:295 (+),score=29.28 TRINITY_DN15520_c0_g1_i1:99-887(+)